MASNVHFEKVLTTASMFSETKMRYAQQKPTWERATETRTAMRMYLPKRTIPISWKFSRTVRRTLTSIRKAIQQTMATTARSRLENRRPKKDAMEWMSEQMSD